MFFHKSNSNEAFNAEKKIRVMKRLTLPKNWSDEAFNASSPRFIAVNTV